jgi:hypothetical protein
MATGAAWLKGKNHLVRKRKTDLTLTGLLMEGLGTHYQTAISRINPRDFCKSSQGKKRPRVRQGDANPGPGSKTKQ